VLADAVEEAADDIRTRRALDHKPCLRGFAETHYQAQSWNQQRRVCARIEATTQGLDIRFIVTSLETGSAEHIYETIYCARGQAENLIKLHKTQLASDRTSCRSPLANQMRLILHTAAYWLILTVRDAIPKAHLLATAEFATHPTAPFEARHPRHRNRFPNTLSLRCCLPRGSPHPPHRRRADALRTVSHGAAIAPPTPSRNLQRLPQAPDPSDGTDAAHNRAFDCYP
jgi:hypothetical protein